MTDQAPKKRRGRPAKKKVETELAPAFIDESKKIGRPKGAVNKSYPTINSEKEICPHCRKTALNIIKVYPPIQVCHRSQGATFNTLVRKQCRCKACNLCTVKNVYEIR